VDNPRPEKVAIVNEVQERIAASDAVILTEYRGMTVGQISNLRRQLRESGGEYKVYKNTLVRFAARNLEIDIDALLTGPTAIAFIGAKADGSEGDIAGVAKTLRTYAREVPALVVKGGVLGRSAIDAEGARALADMPTRSQVLSQIAGLLQAPLTGLAGLLDAVPRTFLYAVQARIDQQGGEPAGETEAA
jgi:large subunit ribosomal protein L10